jgi:hypothetical protein
MDVQTWATLGAGVVIAVTGWSLRQNVRAFGSKLDEVAKDVRAVAIQAASHETQLAVLSTRVASTEGRVTGLEERERERLSEG